MKHIGMSAVTDLQVNFIIQKYFQSSLMSDVCHVIVRRCAQKPVFRNKISTYYTHIASV